VYVSAISAFEIGVKPADRLNIATAQYHTLTILTPDSSIQSYPDASTRW
jgi:PIN domain nuclease of toxin-antitoxin system